ncbi:MAG: hypothetical protein V2A34_05490, partial [Lentisphaerota bacterium]
MTLRYLALGLLWMISSVVWAEDNTTVLITGVTSNPPGPVYVGQTGTNNSLVVTNAGVFISTNGAAIGTLTNANWNIATVTGAGSVWTTRICYVGLYGGWNRLTVSAGGRFINSFDTEVGYFDSASNNSLLVTGAGTLFSNSTRTLYVGTMGSGNSATISNGGMLQAASVYLGGDTNSAHNRLLVTGAGSKLKANFVRIGETGSYNRIEVRDGGLLDAETFDLGWLRWADHNTAVVEGFNSIWTNRYKMYIGNEGSFNSLFITNAGSVFCENEALVGAGSNSMGNTVLVEGSGSRWVVSNMFYLGPQSCSNRMEIRNYGTVACAWNAYLGDSTTSSTNSYGNYALVTGANTRWYILGSLFMGREAGWNRLELRNGAMMTDSNAYLGWGISQYPSNTADVSGPGTVWTNLGEVYVDGPGNSITLSNGARLYAASSRICDGREFERAQVVVNGSNTVWASVDYFGVGFYGSYADATITNGGQVISGSGVIGLEAGDYDNSVRVTGPGSIWTNAGGMTLGFHGSDNTLSLSRGGRVYSQSARMGVQPLSRWNVATIADTGSLWSCAGSFTMGYDEGNRINIENGGRLFCTNMDVGVGLGAASNRILVTGNGSLWTNAGRMQIGTWHETRDNRVEIFTGAWVVCQSAILGDERLADGNSIAVSGPGARLVADEVWVGRTGSYNHLSVENGGCLVSQLGDIGNSTAATGNWIRLAGAGSVWSNTGPLMVGRGGPGSVVSIQTGAILRVSATTDVVRGTIDLSGGLLLGQQVNLLTNAVLSGAGTVQVAYANSYGAVRVGNPIGRITVAGSFYQKDGSSL